MEEKPAVKAPETAAPQTEVIAVVDDNETKIAALEAEKAKLLVERENYKVGMLKEKAKNRGEELPDEEEDERIERITRKTLADSRLAEITRETNDLLHKALKENKELKLAHLKKDPAAALGSHSESTPVRDTVVTPEQAEAFKKMKWSDKDIERYKKNLLRYGGR